MGNASEGGSLEVSLELLLVPHHLHFQNECADVDYSRRRVHEEVFGHEEFLSRFCRYWRNLEGLLEGKEAVVGSGTPVVFFFWSRFLP